MVQETKRFLAYICPHCAQSVIVERNLFSLAAAPVHIKCPCGKSELGVEFKPNRVQLTVPCLFCGRAIFRKLSPCKRISKMRRTTGAVTGAISRMCLSSGDFR